MEIEQLVSMFGPDLERTVYDNTALLLRGRLFCKLTLARMYGQPGIAEGMPRTHILFATERRTLGVIDANNGTAWDSIQLIPNDVSMAGLTGEALHYGEAPSGWRMIIMPPMHSIPRRRWRCAPEPLCQLRHMVRPQLRAFGLLTHGGGRGMPRRTLIDCTTDHRDYRNGLPPWVYNGREPVSLNWLTRNKLKKILRGRNDFWRTRRSSKVTPLIAQYQAAEEKMELIAQEFYQRARHSKQLHQQIIRAIQTDSYADFFSPVATAADTLNYFSSFLYRRGPIYLDKPASDYQAIRTRAPSIDEEMLARDLMQ